MKAVCKCCKNDAALKAWLDLWCAWTISGLSVEWGMEAKAIFSGRIAVFPPITAIHNILGLMGAGVAPDITERMDGPKGIKGGGDDG